MGAGGAAAGSGVFIDINGTKVPKEKAVVFLHFGHSNMVGHGTGPADLDKYFFTPQDRLWSYSGSQFTPAKERTAPEPATTTHAGGPGMAWLKAAAAIAGPDYHFISISRAQGALTTADWQKGGPLYSALLAKAKPLVGKVTFGGAFVMIGVTDRHLTTANWAGFPARYAKIISDLRADLQEPNLPILQCDYEVEATDPVIKVGSPFANAMQPMLAKLPTQISNLALVPADKTGQQDDHHFSLAGHKLWADRGVAIMKDKGWFPWTK